MWQIISNISSVLGILTVLLSGYSAWRLYRQDKRIRELVNKKTSSIQDFQERITAFEGVQSVAPFALAISLLPNNNSIKGDVQRYINAKLEKWKHMHVEPLNMSGISNKEDLEAFINELRKKRRFFEEQNATEIHVFFAGPGVAAMLVGAMFDNWIPVKLYHKPQPAPPEVYEYWTPLIK